VQGFRNGKQIFRSLDANYPNNSRFTYQL